MIPVHRRGGGGNGRQLYSNSLRKQGKMCRSIICFGLFTLSVMTLIYFVKTGNFPRLGFE